MSMKMNKNKKRRPGWRQHPLLAMVDRFLLPLPELPDGPGMAALCLAGAAAALTVSEYEKNNPVYAFYRLDAKGKLSSPLRLVFLSDLHEKEFGEGNAELLRMIEEADPDFVLIGGDMVTADKHTGKKWTAAALALCKALADRYPVCYGNGNHESRLDADFVRALWKTGVIHLSDRSEAFGPGGELVITGVNLDKQHYAHFRPTAPDEAYLRDHIGTLNTEKYNILLAHSPAFLDAYAATGADLVLSGHYHGGTIRLPGDVGLMTPQYQFLNTNVTGLKTKGGTSMIVSSGLGTHTVKIRLNNRPQVVVVDLV